MLEFSEITINDKALFDKYLGTSSKQISEMTFTNFFMWRNLYKFRFAEVGGLLCIIAVPEGKDPFCYPPLGLITRESFQEAVSALGEYFQSNNWKLRFERVDEALLESFKEYAGEGIEEVFLEEQNSDYVYYTENLITLKGKKYDGKRNHINRFKKTYSYEYVPLTQEHIGECSNIMDRWCSERNCEDNKEFYNEKLANMELLNNMSRLDCKGALIKVEGKAEAFTVGEMLNENTAVIHIEKANGSINGLYTMINQQFCEREWAATTFINREQDLGLEGLRKAKLSYHPAMMVNKYRILFGKG